MSRIASLSPEAEINRRMNAAPITVCLVDSSLPGMEFLKEDTLYLLVKLFDANGEQHERNILDPGGNELWEWRHVAVFIVNSDQQFRFYSRDHPLDGPAYWVMKMPTGEKIPENLVSWIPPEQKVS